MTQNQATALGLFAAATVTPIFYAFFVPLGGKFDLGLVLITLTMIYWISLTAIAVLGFPAFIVLKRYKLVKWWSAIGVGLIAGPLAVIGVVQISSTNFEELLKFSVLGGIAGFAFWIFWRLGRS